MGVGGGGRLFERGIQYNFNSVEKRCLFESGQLLGHLQY